MQHFIRHFIIPLARQHHWGSFCEIGACTGLGTDQLLKLPDISYTIIDPCLDTDLAIKYANDDRVTVLKRNSLDALPRLSHPYDCILIDGDHNWYTVFNELRLIRERALLRPGGMIFFHDVAWPYARRDMYYQPDTIPREYRQSYESKGIIRGQSPLAESGGYNPGIFNANHEGGQRNGVLTAIEDFVSSHPTDYRFCRVRLQWGLGILQYRRRRLSEDFAFLQLRAKANLYSVYGILHDRNRETGRSVPARI
jgi:Methyltransferase domain